MKFFWLSALLLAPGCGGGWWGGEKTFLEETIVRETAKVDRLSCITRSGKIEVQASTEEKIRLVCVKRASAAHSSGAQAILKRIVISEKREGSTLRFRAEIPPELDSLSGGVDFAVSVPARFALNLESNLGTISVSGTEGAMEIHSHNGSVRIKGARDPVQVFSHDGDVFLDGEPAMLNLSTHNGDVSVALGRLRSFEKKSRIETHRGDIQLMFPKGFSASMSVISADQPIQSELSARWESRGLFEVKGLMGAGGVSLDIESHSGRVRLLEMTK